MLKLLLPYLCYTDWGAPVKPLPLNINRILFSVQLMLYLTALTSFNRFNYLTIDVFGYSVYLYIKLNILVFLIISLGIISRV